MGGAIGVTSKPGEGSTFTVDLTLPVAEMRGEAGARGPDPKPAVLAMLRERRERARILVAEDNATTQLIVRHLLKNVDIDVDVVGNGREAVAAAARGDYAAIFMDMRMPEMDGLEAARAIRRHGGRLADVPIIALTASVFPEDIRACREAGMDHFLPKPVSKDMLLAAMYQVLSEAAPRSESAPIEAMSTP
jgi:CheY-like chemotaxis protein